MIVLAYAVAACVSAVLCILNGIVLKLTWGWFMAPVFGLPVLSLAQAIGIGLVIGFMTHQYVPIKQDAEHAMEALKRLFQRPAVVLLASWIVHCFM